MINPKPKFITFEGGEGSGKSTQSRMLHDYLNASGIKSIITREIGGTKEAEKIREIIIHAELYKISELLLVMAARYEHVNKVIIPALEQGIWVICDRYVDSSAAYQSEDSGLLASDIYELHEKLIPGGLMPDITFFMDIDPEIGLTRSKNTGVVNKFEEKDMIFHKNLYEKFKGIASSHKDRIISIDCEGLNEEQIHKEIVGRIGR